MDISGSPALSFFFEGKQKKEVGEGGTGRVEGGQVTEREDCGSSWEGLVLTSRCSHLGKRECAMRSMLRYSPRV